MYDPLQIIMPISLFLNIFFYWKIAVRFRRNGAHALWLFVPFGAFYFWWLMATQPVAQGLDLDNSEN